MKQAPERDSVEEFVEGPVASQLLSPEDITGGGPQPGIGPGGRVVSCEPGPPMDQVSHACETWLSETQSHLRSDLRGAGPGWSSSPSSHC